MPEQRIRDLINSPRRLHALLSDRPRWNRVCAALDTLGDTQLAIDAYVAEEISPKGAGPLYLVLYGILQVLYVQQDALKDLAGALNRALEIPQALRDIRDARNASIGHPTFYRYGAYSNTINRSSMSVAGFELYKWPQDGDPEITYINVSELARQQTDLVRRSLEEAAMALEEEERDHRKQWRRDPLAPKLDDGIGYAFEKLSEGVRRPDEPHMARWGLQTIEERIEKFKEALDQRGLLGAYPMSIDPILEEVEYPIARLGQYLDGKRDGFGPADAEIFVYFLRSKLDELLRLARELDEDYASDTV